MQRIIEAGSDYSSIEQWIAEQKIATLFLVCDMSLQFLRIKDWIEKLSNRIKVVKFDDFQPNPLYESVTEGVKLFLENSCDGIMAVGGGSAIDVAKCIKLYSNMDHSRNYLEQTIVPNTIPFLAMPTTAGTGSEATRYAVIYYNDAKQSVTHESCIPEAVVFDTSALFTLPLYQKKSTLLDAFCHAVESFWSVNSTEESRSYSKTAIEMILQNIDAYLKNEEKAASEMLKAAHIAGKAINITQTTAGHAMCYKITSLFHVAHGHAAALCDRVLFAWMVEHPELCIDQRGPGYLESILLQIAQAMGETTAAGGAERLKQIFSELELEVPEAGEEQFELLKTSVNPVRLKNHPVQLTEETINMLYHKILRVQS